MEVREEGKEMEEERHAGRSCRWQEERQVQVSEKKEMGKIFKGEEKGTMHRKEFLKTVGIWD